MVKVLVGTLAWLVGLFLMLAMVGEWTRRRPWL